MDSLLDDVDSLIAPDLSADATNWCENCQSLRQEIKRLQDEQLQNFGKLKQKIISTDLLIKKFKSKSDDYDVQCKRTEEANKRADKYQRQTEILETQLKASLLDTEPLRKTAATIEIELKQKNAELQTLKDRVVAAESAQKQYEHLSRVNSAEVDRLDAEKKELAARVKYLEAGRVDRGAAKEFKSEISNLKKENTVLHKNEKRLKKRLTTALCRIEKLMAVIKEGKFSAARSRRTVSGLISSPLKSPGRSPRTDAGAGVKLSPRGGLRTRTASEKSSMSGINDAVKSENEEKLESDSSSSSGDSDDSGSSDDSDDAGSLMSVKWTFSPVTKCLSPLPPSPACFLNRKHGGLQTKASLTMEEDGMVSDIADELEQQLLQDDENQTGNDELQKTLTEDASFMVNDDRDNIDGIERSSEENTATEIDDICVPFTSKELKQSQDCNAVVSEPEINKNNINAPSIPTAAAETEECIHDKTDNSIEITKQDKTSVDTKSLDTGTKNKSEITLTLKEKLANSMEIISPIASRKRIGQTHLQTMSGSKHPENGESSKEVLNVNTELDHKPLYGDKNKKTPPVKRSVRLKTLSESEHSQPECDVTDAGVDTDKTGMKNNNLIVQKEKHENSVLPIFGGANQESEECEMRMKKTAKNEFGRNDTEEFTPEMTNNTPTFCDLEAEMNCTLANVDLAEKTHTDDKNDNLEFNCNNSKTSIKTVTEDANSELKLDANLSNTCTNSKNTGVILETPDEDKKQLISKQEETIVKGELAHKDKVSVNLDKNPMKPAVKKARFGAQNFIKFQKSSVGTLSNEIEEFGYLNDYEVLSREDSVNSDSKSSKVHLNPNFKKNVKRRLRKKCNYRDLDAQQNENVTHRNDVSVNDDDVVKDKIKNSAKAQSALDKGITYGKSQTEVLDNSVKSEKDTELKTENSDDTNGKLKPTRQLSTGFQVNNSVLERSLSNESSGSIRTSPLRLLHFEAGICETIREEDEGKDVKKFETDENILEKVKQPSDNSNLIFGVEDLLADFAPIEEHIKDAEQECVHTVAKPFCDRTAVTNCSTGLLNYDLKLNTKSLSVLDDESNKPGCSYMYKKSDSSEFATGSAFSKVIKERNKDITSLSRSSSSSMGSMDRSSPVSPLSISPFNFLCPVSPLPPSPVREIDRKSPEQAPLDQDQQKESENLLENNQLELAIQKTENINDHIKCEENDLIPELKQNVLGEDENEKRESKLNESDDYKKELAFDMDVEGNKNMNDMVLIEIYPLEDNKEGENTNELEHGSSTNIDENFEAETVNKSIETSKITDVAETESVVKTKGGRKKDQLESPKKPLKSSSLKVESLMLSPVPHMISPVRSPKGRLSTKSKASLHLNLQDKIKPCVNNDKKQKRGPGIKSTNEFNKGAKSKQVNESVVEKTDTIVPRISRSRASIDNSSLDMCARKSGKATVRRKSMSVEKIELNVVPKQVSSDASECKNAKQNLDKANNKKGSGAIASHDISISDTVPEVSARSNVVKNGDAVKPWSEMKTTSKLESDVMVDEKGDSLVLQELPVGHDNLAFKRKSRVAHKPNTQPLKPPKIKIIEAPRLPPVSGRKRKCLDKNTETKEKKPCEDSKLLKEKPAETISSEDGMLLTEKSVDTVSSKEDTKLMQGFLKSSELAESFVGKYVTKNDGDDVGIQLLNTCLECLGKVRTDSIDVVHKTCISDEYLHFEGELLYLSDVEKKAVHLIQYLISQTQMKLSEAVVMRNIWKRLFTQDLSPHFVGKMAQFRVFTALCALQGDLVLVRTMLYHMLTCGYMNIVSFVVPVVSVWPEALRKDPADRPDKVVSNSMVLVMEEIITKSLRSQVSKITEKPLLILQKMCLWSGNGNDVDALVKLLVTRILAITESETPDKGELFETTKALELLCDHQNWRWFKDRFINRFGLQTAANKYTCKTIQKPVSADYMGALLKVTSHCMHTLCSDITERDYIRIIENWLMPILSHKPGNNMVQHYCLETLLELTPLYPSCLAMIQQWFIENKSAINRELKARLEELRTEYLKTFGLLCRPFFAD